ncbi:YolD-like family protein [Halobacillus halophilus]|uniref:YolD-like protein n=1 Tax=Halobacillus halophilus (strain ATCC 35676 / DSM 2266 / JCM 20832 / KCTC 3685 / LMG 17431 / NBRC 102448 / NCIMB 2269) TaxID=866895 RepID=I0JS99_HALH3|nr:YolD-like family protein [Halobacillus halophilus]ASF40959.1 YolD-like family protein [Halobacillus halophilus]CCG47020.1 hypothetical protein HBHAL_4682 [Halobacillus halophilus DSM 2266]
MSNGPNDRGTIKWTSLMLPEHVEAIQKLWKEDDRVEKAILDGQQLEELEFALQRARRDDLPVEIKHHNGFNYSSTKVKVLNLDPGTRKIRCLDIEEKINTSLSFEDIFSVEFL